jgi:transcriptional regulator with XRE-family HTH domain
MTANRSTACRKPVIKFLAFERYFQYPSNCMNPRFASAQAPQPAPVLAKATLNAAQKLDLNGRELAEIIGTSEASISRLRAGKGLDPQRKEGELALLFLRLYRSLDTLTGGDEAKARTWLHAMNDHLRGIPAERIRTIEGMVDVVQYLDAMRGRL